MGLRSLQNTVESEDPPPPLLFATPVQKSLCRIWGRSGMKQVMVTEGWGMDTELWGRVQGIRARAGCLFLLGILPVHSDMLFFSFAASDATAHITAEMVDGPNARFYLPGAGCPSVTPCRDVCRSPAAWSSGRDAPMRSPTAHSRSGGVLDGADGGIG